VGIEDNRPVRSRAWLLRAGLAGAAVVIAAWFVLVGVQTHATDAATTIITGHARPTAAQAAHAGRLLDTAATLNPDREVDLLRSQLAYARADKPRARRLAGRVAHAEPDNVQAWLQLTRVSYGAPAAVALQHAARLAPTVKSGS
jgi:hypothetical protein